MTGTRPDSALPVLLSFTVSKAARRARRDDWARHSGDVVRASANAQVDPPLWIGPPQWVGEFPRISWVRQVVYCPHHCLSCAIMLHAAMMGRSGSGRDRTLSAHAIVAQQSIASKLLRGELATPAFVYDEARLIELGSIASSIRRAAGAKVLYAVKAAALPDVLDTLSPSLDGFSVSSLFEARLVHEFRPDSPLHLTTPGLRGDEIDELAELCGFLSFNSVSQLTRYGRSVSGRASVGLRVNTRVSRVADPRYDPARVHSKLGVPIEHLAAALASSPVPVDGLHIHTNADSEDLTELVDNVISLVDAVGPDQRFSWVNLGGGYAFEAVSSLDPLVQAVRLAKERLAESVFLEPGAALVRSAGYLVASVIDLFESDATTIAVLDATVNHMPEVLEFDYQPDVVGQADGGLHQYILAGCTCLAGDVFGNYRLVKPLEVGSRVVFPNAGAYSLVKAHRFNGVNLPIVCLVKKNGNLQVRKQYTFEDYLNLWTPND